MSNQPAYLDIEFLAAGCDRARMLFPELCHDENPPELVVVTDEGDVYTGDGGWIVCLYALVQYRSWSYRLANPSLRALARNAFELLSANRQSISHALMLKSDDEIARQMSSHAPAC